MRVNCGRLLVWAAAVFGLFVPVGLAGSAASAASVSPVAQKVATVLPPVTVGRNAWVAVSVATLWHTPWSARAVDRPALANPASIRQWLSRMTLSDRRGLDGRADTQALLGDRVIVVARSGAWVKVVVPEQPTPLDARGYPGWVPMGQLTALHPVATASVATVVARTTFLRTDNVSATPVTEVSFGTRLPGRCERCLGAGGDADRSGAPGLRQCRGGPDARRCCAAGDRQ